MQWLDQAPPQVLPVVASGTIAGAVSSPTSGAGSGAELAAAPPEADPAAGPPGASAITGSWLRFGSVAGVGRGRGGRLLRIALSSVAARPLPGAAGSVPGTV